jgi:Ca2+-binding RTX toxin-like protein
VSGGCDDPEVAPGFPGIDTSCVPDQAPAGCLGDFDLASHTLTLKLAAPDTTMLLSVAGSDVQANGVTCSASDNTPATTDNVHALVVEGTDAEDTVIFDLGPGSFGANLLSDEGGIQLNLAGGANTVAVRGTNGDDALAAWRFEDTSVISLTPQNTPSVHAYGVTALVISLGPGNDRWGAYPGEPPEGEDIGPLSARLIAYAGDGDDDLTGGSANDFFLGGAGNDTLNGGDGDDWFDGADPDGTDVMNGGLGSDTITYVNRASGVKFTMCKSSADLGCAAPDCTCEAINGEAGEGDTLANVENGHGTAFDDDFEGSASDNTFYAYGGNDVLVGQDGNDFLFGDQGNDTLVGGIGDDYLDGAEGADTFDGGDGAGDICLVESGEPPLSCELH